MIAHYIERSIMYASDDNGKKSERAVTDKGNEIF